MPTKQRLKITIARLSLSQHLNAQVSRSRRGRQLRELNHVRASCADPQCATPRMPRIRMRMRMRRLTACAPYLHVMHVCDNSRERGKERRASTNSSSSVGRLRILVSPLFEDRADAHAAQLEDFHLLLLIALLRLKGCQPSSTALLLQIILCCAICVDAAGDAHILRDARVRCIKFAVHAQVVLQMVTLIVPGKERRHDFIRVKFECILILHCQPLFGRNELGDAISVNTALAWAWISAAVGAWHLSLVRSNRGDSGGSDSAVRRKCRWSGRTMFGRVRCRNFCAHRGPRFRMQWMECRFISGPRGAMRGNSYVICTSDAPRRRPLTAPTRSPREFGDGSYHSSFYGIKGQRNSPLVQYRVVPSRVPTPMLPTLRQHMPATPVVLTRPGTAVDGGVSRGRWQNDRRRLKTLEVGKLPFKSWTSPDVVFDQIDRDNSGFVEMAEIHRFFRGKLDQTKIDEMFAELDVDDSGSVSREEWRKGYFKAGFGEGTIVGQSSEGLSILLGLVGHSHKINFQDLAHNRPPAFIPKVEERGITLYQLRELYAHVHARAGPEGWMGMEGSLIAADTATMYDVLRYVIKPCTKRARCSYTEFISPAAPQAPFWCVSHWWGTPLRELIECLEQHARDRGISEMTPYWISAFAVNQHNVGSDYDSDVSEAFCKALTVATGTVAVLDSQGMALKRVWLLYEMYRTVRNIDRKLDVYTWLQHICVTKARIDGTRHRHCTAVGLVDGFAMTDLRDYETNKTAREVFFPLTLVVASLGISLHDSFASAESDRRALLRAVANGDAAEQDVLYDECNTLLRARFAAAALRAALDANVDLYAYCLAEIKKSGLRRLFLPFSRCGSFNNKRARELVAALPATLETLDIGFKDVESEEEFLVQLATRLKSRRAATSTSFSDEPPDEQKSASSGFGIALTSLSLKSDAITRDGLAVLGEAIARGCAPKLRTLDFGFPLPFEHETALELAQHVLTPKPFDQKIDFYGGRLSSHVNLSKTGITSADLILIIASAATGGCGQLISLDVSHNKINNEGLMVLERSLRRPHNKLPDLSMIDLSGNKEATNMWRMRIFDARRGPRPPPGEYQATRFELSSSHEFRIVCVEGKGV